MFIPVDTQRCANILGSSGEPLSREALVIFTTCSRLYMEGIPQVFLSLEEWMVIEEHL
jgi:hypothetical protein